MGNFLFRTAYPCIWIGDGSIKCKPHFQLALSTFRNTMTFTVNLYGSPRDKEEINSFFALLDEQIPE